MTEIVGHRGAAGHAPENTLLSFKKAIELGCHRTEMDVHLSKDNKVVVIHDETVDRMTDGKGMVSKMALAKLKKLNLPQGQKIPTLQEVIDLCRDKIDLQIELKGNKTAGAVNDIICRNNLVASTFIISFDKKQLNETRELNPDIKIGYLFRKFRKTVWKTVAETKANYIGPKCKIVSQEMVATAHAKGLKVYAYHVNTQEEAQKLISYGVDSIGTDFPELFL